MRTPFKNIGIITCPATTGLIFAWVGVFIYAASNSIVTLLVEIGAANPLAGGRNAITYTNLLFLGSLISLVPMAVLFRGDWTRVKLERLSRGDWGFLTLSAFLSSALTPGLIFYALEHSSVTNVILIGRIEPPLFLLAAWVFLKERFNPRVFLAGIVALSGGLLMIGLGNNGGQGCFGWGEAVAVAATLSYIASTIVARKVLKRVPMGIFSVYRTAAGTLIYFLMISALQGSVEFQDLFAPILLKWVWVYAVIVVIFGQLVWFVALKHARSEDMSLATSFSPLAGIAFAILLLGEDPGPGFLPGGFLILLAVFIGQMRDTDARSLRAWVALLRRVWEKRPTYTPGEITGAIAPVAAFYGTPRRA